jgi:outer membrane immunogenic protein
MKKLFLATVGLIALSVAPALAADLPAKVYTKAPAIVPPPIYNWSGFYIGINGGGGSSRECWNLNTFAGVAVVPSAGEGCHNATGGLVGGQIGYRWQSYNIGGAGNSVVFGVEAQGDWADFKGSNTSTFFGPLLTNQTKIDAIGLFTGQVGYAWNNVLWYVKAGAAVTDNKYNGFFTPTNFLIDTASETRWGGTVGTGIEVGFAPGWSVAFEYNHLFMGSSNHTFSTPVGGLIPGFVTRGERISEDIDMGTVRVNYTFGGPVVAKY